MNAEEIEHAAKMFEALGHARRVEIVRALREFSNTPAQLARQFDCSWTTIAKHLKVLQDAGIVERYEAEYGTGYAYTLSHGWSARLGKFIDRLQP